ncbi:MAG: ubiquinone/menaquinone biosynthesis methyltransferase [Actinomycetota bacterium]|nr:ubiquinone/menaquinone biosynthesis methyltransferase [Actinomycetota bacterium]
MDQNDLSPRARHARKLFADLPSTYDGLGRLVSFGQDPRWRRFMVSRLPVDPDARVLDVATGTAAVAIEIARRTGSRLVGLDQSDPMVREGIRRVSRANLEGRIRFVLGSAERLPFQDASFDAVTFAYLLRYVDDVGSTLKELARVVRPGGVLAGQEFHVPPRTLFRVPWKAYTRGVMPLVGRVVSRQWRDAFSFLSDSIPDFYRRYPLEKQLELWRAAGMDDVQARVMSLGAAVVVSGTKRGSG